MSGRLGAEAGVTSVEYVGFGVVIAAVIVVLFALDPSLAERLRSPIDDQVCDVLRADCEGERLPAGERVAGGGEAAAGDGTGTASGGGSGAAGPAGPGRVSVTESDCVVASEGRHFGGRILLAIVDIDGYGGYRLEGLADGRHQVTFFDRQAAGLSSGAGGRFTISHGTGETGGAAEARGGILWVTEDGDVAVFDTRGEADHYISDRKMDRFVEGLLPGFRGIGRGVRWLADRATGHDRMGIWSESEYNEQGIQMRAHVRGTGPDRGPEVGGDIEGVKRVTDHRDGSGSMGVRLVLGSEVDVPIGEVATLSPSGDLAASLVLDRSPSGTPTQLRLTFEGTFAGAPGLERPLVGQSADGLVEGLGKAIVNAKGEGQGRAVLDLVLRLDRPSDGARAERLIADLQSLQSQPTLRALGDLYRWTKDDAEVGARLYTDLDREYGFDVRGRKGIGLGLDMAYGVESGNLAGAWELERGRGIRALEGCLR